MANVEKFIPFIIKWETGLVKKGLSNEQLFEEAKKTGWADDPDDLGGATMCGITIGSYKEYCRKKGYPTPTAVRLKRISYEDWKAILKTMYWDRWKADEIKSQSVAETLVDWTWASGVHGIKIPQQLLKVTNDGIVGNKTLEAVNAKNPRELFDIIKIARFDFIDAICKSRPANEKFKRGWMNRINDIQFLN